MPATLTIKARCWYATENEWRTPGAAPDASQVIVPGVTVEYLGHVVGGMVRVRHNGRPVIIHPGCTAELS